MRVAIWVSWINDKNFAYGILKGVLAVPEGKKKMVAGAADDPHHLTHGIHHIGQRDGSCALHLFSFLAAKAFYADVPQL